ncbi:MAG TPA: HisA/HisF-related TIM barrel protein, partial [Anseongella sp.]|nr:HisA/HisF-related TIM barrel protein [Anseongella sp.]
NSMPAYQETFNTYDHLVQELDRQGIAYLHLIELAAKQHEEGRRLIEKIRKGFGKTLILNGGYTAESAAEALEAGRADLVAFGAPFISNPDLPERMKNGIPLSQADPSTFYSADEKGYTDYPFYS